MKTSTQLFMVTILNCLFIGSSILYAQFDGTNITNTFFDSRRDYPMGGYIEITKSADFNNDGFEDMVCGAQIWEGSKYIYQIKIFINNEDGSYKSPVAINCLSRIRDIAVGDFDNDGWVDLVVLTKNGQDLEIIMNQGDGLFVWERLYPYYGASSQTIISMDKNNDGLDDILLTDYLSLNIYLSNGDGTFALGNAYSDFDFIQIPLDIQGSLISWDVNHDEYQDVLIYGSKVIYTDSVNYYFQPIIATYINNGDTTMQPGVETPYGNTIDDRFISFDIGNFNTDSEIDLLMTDFQNKRSILTNNGDGSFSENISFVKDYSLPVSCGDVNGDGYSDIIISYSQNATLSVMLNNGSNDISFADSVNYSGKFSLNPTFKIKLFISDLNNNGYDDIILYDWTVSTIFNHGDGSFPVDNTVGGMGTDAFDILADDFNGDGAVDLMTIDASRSLYLKYNDGNGNFSNLQSMNCYLNDPRGIISGDFNADEIVDFGVASTNGINLFYGLEGGGFQLQNTTINGFIAGYDGMTADFNNDGNMDIATYYSGSYMLNVILNDSIGVYHVDSYNIVGGNLATGIASADIDGDNDEDIVVSAYNNSVPGGPGVISIRYNDGTGQFPTTTTIPTEFMPEGVVLEDINDDGYPDMAVTQYGIYNGYVSVYLNNQDGTFPTQVNYAQLYAPEYRDISTADIDNDGDIDLLASIEAYDEIAILLNEGDGTFPEIHYYPGGDNIKAFTIARLDSGSTKDVAVTSSIQDRNFVYLYLNTGLNIPTDLVDKDNVVPNQFLLKQNYPNPFNPTTTIMYSIPKMSKISLTLFNLLGQEIATLVNDEKPAGNYTLNFNATHLPSGVYFYRIQAGNFIETKKMILLK
jgi:hypothetical protein